MHFNFLHKSCFIAVPHSKVRLITLGQEKAYLQLLGNAKRLENQVRQWGQGIAQRFAKSFYFASAHQGLRLKDSSPIFFL